MNVSLNQETPGSIFVDLREIENAEVDLITVVGTKEQVEDWTAVFIKMFGLLPQSVTPATDSDKLTFTAHILKSSTPDFKHLLSTLTGTKRPSTNN